MKELLNKKAWKNYHNPNKNYTMIDLYPDTPSDMDTGWADHVDFESEEARANFMKNLPSNEQYCVQILVDKSNGNIDIAAVTIYQ
jgi:hypothetical protein